MNKKNNLLLCKKKYFSKETIHNKLRIYDIKLLDIKKKFCQKITFNLNSNNNKYYNNKIRNESIKFKKGRNKSERYLKLSFSNNTQKPLKKYKTNNFFNNSFYNLNKLKITHSCKEINKNKNYFDSFEGTKNINRIKRNTHSKSNKTIHLNKINTKTNENNNIVKYNKSQMINILKKNKKNNISKEKINIFRDYINNDYKLNHKKYINLKGSIANLKINKLLSRNKSMGLRLKNKKTNWKNNILETIISNLTNINKNTSKINFYDDNNNHHKIKMFTILDLYHKNKKNFGVE